MREMILTRMSPDMGIFNKIFAAADIFIQIFDIDKTLINIKYLNYDDEADAVQAGRVQFW